MDNFLRVAQSRMRSRGCSLFFFFRFCLRSSMCNHYYIVPDSCQVIYKIFSNYFVVVAIIGEYTASRYRVYTVYVL